MSMDDYSVLAQIALCPLSSMLIIAITFIYSRLNVIGTSIRPYSLTHNDLFNYSATDIDDISSAVTQSISTTSNTSSSNQPIVNQYYRIFSSPFLHTNFLHLLFNILTLWECRKIEYYQGTFFYFRYSMLLIIFEAFITCLMQYIILTIIGPRLRINVENIRSLEVYGSSGLVCGWIAYISTQNFQTSINLFGFISFHPLVAPVVCTLTSQLLMPKVNAFSSTSGMLSGYAILFYPLDTMYWSFCFFLDVFFILAWKSPFIRIPFESTLLTGRSMPPFADYNSINESNDGRNTSPV
jgi:membrane associated rhomboid family serine protease